MYNHSYQHNMTGNKMKYTQLMSRINLWLDDNETNKYRAQVSHAAKLFMYESQYSKEANTASLKSLVKVVLGMIEA